MLLQRPGSYWTRHLYSSKGESKTSVLRSRFFPHKGLSFTLHVSSLLAKVAQLLALAIHDVCTMLLWDIRGKRVSQSSSKGISQRSVFKRWGFSHKRSSFTLHVSSLLAKVVEAYTLPTANIHTVLPCDVKSKRIALCKLGNSSWPFATASRQIWCTQFSSSICKLQLPHGSQVTKRIYDCA